MRTAYQVNPDVAIEGMPAGSTIHESIPLQLALQAQVLRLTITAGAATDDVELSVTDDETGQEYTATATGDANEATLAANILAAVRASEIDKLFSVAAIQATDTQDVIVDFTARTGNRSYTLASSGGTGANTVAETVAAGGTGLEFGRMVAFGSTSGTFVEVSSATVLADLAGVLVRTEANHFRPEGESLSSLDLCEAGMTLPVNRRRLLYVRPEDAVARGDSVHLRINGTGRLGGFRGTADGGDTIDVSTIARWVKGAAADGYAILAVDMPA